jgi:hypothetical protein
VLEDDGSTMLMSSPVASDDFVPLDAGVTLGDVSDLSVTDAVVAFLNGSIGSRQIVSLDAGLGWVAENPCDRGEPSQLSAATTSLWVLCTSDHRSTVLVHEVGSPGWHAMGGVYDTTAVLAARTPGSALVAQSGGIWLATAGRSRMLSDNDFSNASMLGFNNADVGFAIVDGRVFRTDDGGSTWTPEDISP